MNPRKEKIILEPYNQTKSMELRIKKLMKENESLYSTIQENEKEVVSLLNALENKGVA